MKTINNILTITALTIALTFSACKAKKVVAKTEPKPAPASEAQQAAPPVQQTAPAQAEETAPAPVKPNYNFTNIQFEFDSGVLKTDSYPALDKAAAEMKKDQSVTFLLAGNSSAEGTDEHNMMLSVERANAVKTYLVNSGVKADNLTVKGFGESKPIADNKTEEGRVLNRRVEIKKQ